MAFWGMEVKPGKPFTHITDSKRGRLHISQATLGFGMGTKKSVVQCNVGNRSPVLLCCLFPEQAESLQLNLEFEEADEVIFSVIGPRSVHLTGYYLGGSRHYKLDDESESYGEDIADTETERSDASDEDEYDDSFIDDSDPQVTPSSPASADGEAEEALHKRKKKNGKPRYRRLRKKYQFSQTDDDCTSQEHTFANGCICTPVLDSESEDMTAISSFFKSAARSRRQEMEEKAEKETGRTINKKIDGDNCSVIAARNADGVVDIERKRQPDQCESILPSAGVKENGAKPKKKMKKQLREEKELKDGEDDFFFGKVVKWDKAQEHKTIADQSSRDMAAINCEAKRTENDKGENPLHLSLASHALVHGKSGKRKKKQAKEEEALGVESPFKNISREDEAQPDEAKCENTEQGSLLGNKNIQKQAHDENTVLSCSIALGHENGLKRKKKRKRSAEDKTLEADRKLTKIVEDEKASQDELKSDGIKYDSSLQDEQNQMLAINDIFYKNADQSANENHNRKKKKKKKSRTQENQDAMNMDESMNKSFMDIKHNNADEKSSQSRTLSVRVQN